jgi:hypothetical protein
MRIISRVAQVLVEAGLGLLVTGILLTAGGKSATFEPNGGNNWPAIVSLLLGSLALWIGSIGIGVVLRCGSLVLAGFVTLAGSFAVPWLLHAVGVTWWSYYSTIPATVVLIGAFIQLGVAFIRITIFAASRIVVALSHRLRPRTLLPYLRSVLIGLALGLSGYFWLARWYEPPLTFSFTVPAYADFEWDSPHGVTAFHLLNPAGGNQVWVRAREFLIAVQIKPQIDWFLRQGLWWKAVGSADMNVVKIIPFALPEAWGSDGLILHQYAWSPTRALTRAAWRQ